jgi:hypothetical protein
VRPIQRMVDEALKALDGDCAALCSIYGRESIPPEKLLCPDGHGLVIRL